MRRSVREALVGFTVLAAIASGLGLWFWLKGVSLARGNWTILASFPDAAGLAKRSPVTYRGVLVGRVRSIRVSGEEVLAELEITDPSLHLARPVVARVGAGSLLGGDAMVSLLSGASPSAGGSLRNAPGPLAAGCDNARLVCDRGRVSGVAAPTLDTVTATVQKMLDQADRQGLIQRMVLATDAFDRTADETRKLSIQGQRFVGDAQQLVKGLNGVVGNSAPIVHNLTAASSEVNQASRSVKRLAGQLDNAATVRDLQATLANARQLTQRWESVGGDVQKLTGDPSFLAGMRSVSVGLGKFFDDLYPGEPSGAGHGSRQGTTPANAGVAAPHKEPVPPAAAQLPDQAPPQPPRRQRRPDPSDRFAPRIKAPAMPVPAYGYEMPTP